MKKDRNIFNNTSDSQQSYNVKSSVDESINDYVSPREQRKRDKKASKTSSFARKRKFKHGGYAVGITAVFVAVVILLNIGGTLLSDKVSLAVDLTSNSDYTLSSKNAEFIKGIKRDVTITVCCDEDEYENTYFQTLYSSGYQDKSSSTYEYLPKFFKQNIYLLKQYARLNSHIKLVFADPQDPSFEKYTAKYASVKFAKGDIFVESTFKIDGKNINRYRLLETTDIFNIDTTYASYGYNFITANNIETAVTSAINTVTADKSYKVTLLTANGGKSIDEMQNLMEMNNYDFTTVDSLLDKDAISSDSDLVIISSPTYDYSEAELDMLDSYLSVKDTTHTIMYIASSEQANLTNLNEFLSEWNFSVNPGNVVYETNTDNCYYSYTNVGMSATDDNGFTKSVDDMKYLYLAASNVPIVAKETSDLSTTTILQIPETAVGRPIDADDKDWSSDDATLKGPFVGLGVSQSTNYDNDANVSSKRAVMVLSSSDFISTSYNSFSQVGNLQVLLASIDTIVGRDSSNISFDTRSFETATFVTPSTAISNVIRIVFIGVIPLAVLACGIVVWIRRRRS